jgi:hypothetical protein
MSREKRKQSLSLKNTMELKIKFKKSKSYEKSFLEECLCYMSIREPVLAVGFLCRLRAKSSASHTDL